MGGVCPVFRWCVQRIAHQTPGAGITEPGEEYWEQQCLDHEQRDQIDNVFGGFIGCFFKFFNLGAHVGLILECIVETLQCRP